MFVLRLMCLRGSLENRHEMRGFTDYSYPGLFVPSADYSYALHCTSPLYSNNERVTTHRECVDYYSRNAIWSPTIVCVLIRDVSRHVKCMWAIFIYIHKHFGPYVGSVHACSAPIKIRSYIVFKNIVFVSMVWNFGSATLGVIDRLWYKMHENIV